MASYWDEIFNSQGESTSLADMNIGSTASTGQGYVPSVPGRLLMVCLIWAGEAATSLAEFVRVELKCTLWSPNLQKFGLAAGGIRTAPAFPVTRQDYDLDQPINTSQPIAGQYIYADAATPVTCNLRVLAKFSGPG